MLKNDGAQLLEQSVDIGMVEKSEKQLLNTQIHGRLADRRSRLP